MCAPTGAGKTVVFELAITRLLIAMGQAAFDSKIVYSKYSLYSWYTPETSIHSHFPHQWTMHSLL